MRKVITAVFALSTLAACSSAPTPAPSPMTPAANGSTGAPDATSAVRGFMAAAKLQSMQSLSLWWGDSHGATRDAMASDELEKRELIMLRCLKHDRYEVVGDAPGTGGTRDVIVNMKYRDSESTTHLTLVTGPHRRWYVQNVDLKPLQSICIA